MKTTILEIHNMLIRIYTGNMGSYINFFFQAVNKSNINQRTVTMPKLCVINRYVHLQLNPLHHEQVKGNTD